MSRGRTKGGSDTRAPLGSGYERIGAVAPLHPAVPKGAPEELRLDGHTGDVHHSMRINCFAVFRS